MSLSDVACRNLKPRDKTYKVADSGGMYIEVTPSGNRLWRLKYRFAGKERKLALGAYPEVSLSEAREARDKAKKLLSMHQDPSLAKQEAKRIALGQALDTFEGTALEWHKRNQAKWSENHATTVKIGYLILTPVRILIFNNRDRGPHRGLFYSSNWDIMIKNNVL